MKILYVGLVDYCHAGGNVIHQLSIARKLIEAGNEVTVLAPRTRGKLCLDRYDAKFVRLTPTLRNSGLPSSLDTFVQTFIAARMHRRSPFDVVYARSNLFTLFLVCACCLMRVPVVLEHNTWNAAERKHSGGWKITAWIEDRLQSLEARIASGNRTVTARLREILIGRGCHPGRVVFIRNGADPERFHPRDRGQALAKFGLAEDAAYLGFIGSFTPWHGVRVAIESMQHVNARDPSGREMKLLLFGSGPEEKNLRSLVSDLDLGSRVIFGGQTGLNRANDAIACFDIALAPFCEKFYAFVGVATIKLGDYAAAGKPVVASALPGIAGLERHGWLKTVAPDSPKALAGGVNELLEEPEIAPQMSIRARDYACGEGSWAAVAAQVQDFLRTISQRRG